MNEWEFSKSWDRVSGLNTHERETEQDSIWRLSDMTNEMWHNQDHVELNYFAVFGYFTKLHQLLCIYSVEVFSYLG